MIDAEKTAGLCKGWTWYKWTQHGWPFSLLTVEASEFVRTRSHLYEDGDTYSPPWVKGVNLSREFHHVLTLEDAQLIIDIMKESYDDGYDSGAEGAKQDIREALGI